MSNTPLLREPRWGRLAVRSWDRGQWGYTTIHAPRKHISSGHSRRRSSLTRCFFLPSLNEVATRQMERNRGRTAYAQRPKSGVPALKRETTSFRMCAGRQTGRHQIKRHHANTCGGSCLRAHAKPPSTRVFLLPGFLDTGVDGTPSSRCKTKPVAYTAHRPPENIGSLQSIDEINQGATPNRESMSFIGVNQAEGRFTRGCLGIGL